MKKAVRSGLLLLGISAILLSSCGTRHCLPDHDEGASRIALKERETVRIGGPTTGCHETEPGAYLVNRTIDLESPHAERRWGMYLQMKLRHYKCADCGTPCKTTSPNAVRCRSAGRRGEERNRQNQRRRYQRLTAARRAG